MKLKKQLQKLLKIIMIIIGILLVLAIVLTQIVIPKYASNYYKSKFKIDENNADITIKKIKGQNGYNSYYFDGPGEDTALIFYPGALVETTSYGELMEKLSANGIDCFLIDAPYYMAILEPKAAKYILEDYKEKYTSWYVGGHSMGGVIASKYASYHYEDLDGLILLASYSIDDLSDTGLEVLSIYGSNDKVLDIESYNENKVNLGTDITEYIIEGGNHAGFADYGEQSGDGQLEIKDQIEITYEQIYSFINNN